MTGLFRRTSVFLHSLPRAAWRRGLALVLAAGVLAAGLAPGPGAHAQENELQSLLQRIERLQRDMNTLQRHVYKGEPPPALQAAPGSTGGELKNTAAARIDLRLSQFEAQLRSLTGQVEEVVYRNNQIRERLERLTADTDLRLRQLEQGMPPATAMQGAPGATGGDRAAFATQPQVFGTVKQADLDAMRSQPVTPGTAVAQQDTSQAGQQMLGAGTQQAAAPGAYVLAGANPEEQYQQAFGLLSQANYGEAELALRAFVAQNPQDALAGNAKYWLGETFYVRQDYQQAAITFAEAYQEYPGSGKAPDNLLKLGMSLSALGSKSDACGTFAELLKRYPQAAATVLQRAKQERQRLACS